MVKDYFQDIVPPTGSSDTTNSSRQGSRPVQIRPLEQAPVSAQDATVPSMNVSETEPDVGLAPRSIRNISMPTRPTRSRIDDDGMQGAYVPRRPSSPWRKKLLWSMAGVCVLAVGGLALFALRPTTITITPRSHTIVFDSSAQFAAYPEATAATGTLPYTVATFDLQDSAQVPSTGVAAATSKASGNVTIYNNYSTSPVKLIQNTRFQTPDGLIFRVPNAVVIPGKTSRGAGSVSVSVIADQPGAEYNVGPIDKFTIPGLQSTPAEYAAVYAQSAKPMAGGASGNQPTVDPTASQAAISDIRARLETRAHQSIGGLISATSTTFDGLMQITYQDLPPTASSDGKTAQINEVAHVSVPVFSANVLAAAIAQTVASDTNPGDVSIVAGKGYNALYQDGSSSPNLGTDPITFILSGTAQIVWNVDETALTQALAGRDSSAFQTVISGFSGIQEAHARIEPFWKSTFPKDPTKIRVDIIAPEIGK